MRHLRGKLQTGSSLHRTRLFPFQNRSMEDAARGMKAKIDVTVVQYVSALLFRP